MATHDYVIDNSTGANVRADINNVLQAILTNNSSSSAPSTTAAYMWWADTTNGVLKIRNSSNNDWVELLQLDGTLTLEDGSASTPALSFRDDLNTGVYSSAADTFNVATAGVERMELGATTIFNEDGADVDFRIEGDTDANLFHVDAGNDRIGISTSTPDSLFHVFAGSAGSISAAASAVITLEKNGDTALQFLSPSSNIQEIRFGDESDNGSGYIQYSHASNFLSFGLNGGSEKMRIDSSGRLLIGHTTSTPMDNDANNPIFAVEGAGNGARIAVRSTDATAGNGAFIYLTRTRGTSAGSKTTVQSGDSLGGLIFMGADGTDDTRAAIIQAQCDGTPGDNDMPGRLVFMTTPDGGINSSERMRIDSSGRVIIGYTEDLSGGDTSALLQVTHSGGGTFRLVRDDTSITSDDNLGRIHFSGRDGGANVNCAEIIGKAIGTHTTTSRPTAIIFNTTASSSATPTERFRIDSSGNLGIGATSPTKKLEIQSTTSDDGILLKSSTGNYFTIAGDANRTTDGQSLIRYEGKWNGTIIGRISMLAGPDTTNKDDGKIAFATASGGSLSQRFLIDHSGNKILDDTFDTSGSGRKSYFTSNGQQYHGRNAHETYIVFQDTSNSQIGGITRGSGSSVAYNTSSDYRLKENVVDLTDAITRLKTLSPKRFNFKSEPSITMDGFLAHEVTAVPEAIEGEKDGVITQAMLDAGTLQGSVGDPIYQGIDQSKLVPLLVAAVQELITKVETLEAA